MEYIHYLIYPIAGLFIVLAIGGIATSHPVVVSASLVSLFLSAYAIYTFQWWPIIVSLIIDVGFKKLFDDPGSLSG